MKSKIARLPARQEKFQPEADPRLADGQASSAEKLSSNVFIEPRRNDLASYYKSADLFLLTSNYEGWGLVVAEAMAGGCPIVMTDVGCAGELVKDGENGLIVKVGDKTVIAAAVESLIENPEKLRAIKQNNLEKAKAFRTKEEYLNRYKKSWEI
ncbi:MAG: glycosyltransferase family 4 protein [Candidatus Portnoybacteria bacterium]|nr:glycosyltransferase family 4 protein [Candidatus Portnoybacteria bacterium]